MNMPTEAENHVAPFTILAICFIFYVFLFLFVFNARGAPIFD